MARLASDSLLWIKAELDNTLLRARQALEAFVEDHDEQLLHECLTNLHQVHGTLRIVEVHGAAQLAAEMEATAQDIKDKKIKGGEQDAFEVLMRAMLQLPDYLERVISGQREMPLLLLSLLNDLRAVRGEVLLSESSLFAQNLAQRGAAAQFTVSGGGDIAALAKKLRPRFQAALLGWFKSGGTQELKQLTDIAAQLEQAASTPGAYQLWWIVGGVLEGLLDNSIEASVALKQLLGQVDRQIKRLLDNGEAALNDDPPTELVNNLLYYIGTSASTGERTAAIKESFQLADLLATEDQEAAGMAGPNEALMRTVSAAIKDDIAHIKDALDIFVRTAKTDVEELAPSAELLKKVGDTLGVLSLDAARASIESEHTRLQGMLAGKQPLTEAVLMDIASALIKVETTLDNQLLNLTRHGRLSHATLEAAEQTVTGLRVEETDFDEVAGAVIRESIINLARVKDSIVEYIKNPAQSEVLRPVPPLVQQIRAGLTMLELSRPSRSLGSVLAYIKRRILDQAAVPPQHELDRMADAIVSIEFYLETVQEGRGNPEAMLDNATGRDLLAQLPSTVRGIAYSLTPLATMQENLYAELLELHTNGLRLQVGGSFGAGMLEARLLGRFNAQNLLAVLGALLALDIPLDKALTLLRAARTVPGRMECFGGGQQPLVVVDYAHTPDALAQALTAARAHCRGTLICVFGCGGDRDRGKRPEMGALAERLADQVIVTDDNPRTEDPAAIVRDILAGMRQAAQVRVEHVRSAAIAAALATARAGDIILVAGKGHEDYQIYGSETRPYSDRATVAKLLGEVLP